MHLMVFLKAVYWVLFYSLLFSFLDPDRDIGPTCMQRLHSYSIFAVYMDFSIPQIRDISLGTFADDTVALSVDKYAVVASLKHQT